MYSVTSNWPGEGSVAYTYGGDGKRRSRTAGGVTTGYNWDSGYNVINEEDSSGNLAMTYIGHTLADASGSSPAAGSWRYYAGDHLASSRSLWSSTKAFLGAYEYEPYGNMFAQTGAAITHKFTGHEWDAAAQMYFAPFRYYGSGTTRWMTRDPLGAIDGPNEYRYVRNNPVAYLDALGMLALRFCRDTGKLCAYEELGGPLGNLMGCFDAANVTDSRSKGPWPAGTYDFDRFNAHPHDSRTAGLGIGPQGIYIFDTTDLSPKRTKMGVHAGRVDDPPGTNPRGVRTPTLGCIRTTEEAMDLIKMLIKGGGWDPDPLTHLEIIDTCGDE
jgi:RHS repeat-associated protein